VTTPVLTFFNNKGGVGKTSLVFHVAWMLAEMGKKIVAIDLDPQANLTSAFLAENELEELWDLEKPAKRGTTIFQCVRPLTEVGDILPPETRKINSRLHLVPGDLSLAGFEDFLSQEWPNALGSAALYRPFRILTAFWQVAQLAAKMHDADLILADVGPNLGAINRSALIGTDGVIIPLAADLFSLQGLRNLGPTLRAWRSEWDKRVANWDSASFDLPGGAMAPLGYILMQHTERLSRPVMAYKRWADRIPSTYVKSVLGQDRTVTASQSAAGQYCLAQLKHYRSLVPMALEVRKPIFELTAADGAIGNHSYAVRDAGKDFRALSQVILSKMQVKNPKL
jgi:cellulose biosynthesis protein BcsQ